MGIFKLSQTSSIDMPAPHFLFPLGRILIVCPSQSCKGKPGADSLPFALIRALLNDQICVFPPNPTLSGQLSACAHEPSAKHTLATIEDTYRETVCEGGAHGVWGASVPVGESAVKHPW